MIFKVPGDGKSTFHLFSKSNLLVLLFFVSVFFISGPVFLARSQTMAAPKWVSINEYRGGISLKWFRVQGAVVYEVQRRIGQKGQFVEIGRVENPIYDDLTVGSGQTAFYRIIPRDQSGNAGPSSEIRYFYRQPVEMEVLLRPHWGPHILKSDGVGLSWTHERPQTILAYNVYRRKSEEGSFSLLTSAVISNYTDRDVSPGVTYQYTVTALNKSLEESDSSDVLAIEFNMPVIKGVTDTRLEKVRVLEDIVSPTEPVVIYNPDKYGFISPVDVEYSAGEGLLYVSDSGSGQIIVINENDDVTDRHGNMGDAPWEFERLLGIELDSDGFLYALDAYRGDIVVFGPDGTFEKRISLLSKVQEYFGEDFQVLYPNFRFGLVDLALGLEGSLFIVDNANGWIYELDIDDRLVNIIGEKGIDPGNMQYPTFISVDDQGQLIVSDTMNSRLQVFDPVGAPVNIIGEKGTGIGQFIRPKGIALDTSGFLYVADSYINAIQIFNNQGEFLALLGDENSLPIDLGSPNGITFVEPDLLYICEKLSGRVQVRRVNLGSKIIFFSQEIGYSQGKVARPAMTTRSRLKEKSVEVLKAIDEIRSLAQAGGFLRLEIPIFEKGKDSLLPGGFPVLFEISRLVKTEGLKVRLDVFSDQVADSKTTAAFLDKRINRIREVMPETAANLKIIPKWDTDRRDNREWIDLYVEIEK
jgi:DNA-binding beta-propeller fold protein YncE